MKKKWVACVSLLLAAVVAFSGVQPLHATDLTDANQKKEEMEGELQDVQSALDELEQYKNDEEEYIRQVDENMQGVTIEIASLRSQIELKKQEIEKKNKQLKKTKDSIKEQYAAMKLRIQYMFENGSVMYEDMMLSSESLAEFLNKAEFISELTTYDREMLHKLQKTQAKLKSQQEELKREKSNLDDLLANEEQTAAGLNALIEDKKSVIADYDKQIEEGEDKVSSLIEEIEAQEKIIAELEELERQRREEEERRRREAEMNQQNVDLPDYDGGLFTWPLPGYTTLSDNFGWREDPFTGEQAYHNGLDIPAPAGTEYVAAYDGEVIWAYYSDSAGNWIGIDHGDGIVSIYMHSSALLVQAGDKVTAGQVIGLVGTTGRSTGPHLHFTVRVNGVDVDPFNYIGG